MPPLLQLGRKITVAQSGLPEDQWLCHPTAEREQQVLEFGNYNNRERVPFIVYVDLECVLHKTEPNKEDALSYAYQIKRLT